MTNHTETAIQHLPDEIRHDPKCAQVTLKARVGAGAVRPETDHVQRVLEALAGSLAASYRRFAATLDISLVDVEIRVEAGLDLNGLAAAAEAIEAARRHGPLRVSCALGFSRSACAVAAWLLTSGRAADVDAAIALIRQRRPAIVLGPGHRAALATLAQARNHG